MQNPKTGYDVYFSAPSGGGKSSLIKGLLKELDNIQLSVSVTTRAKREGETDGRDYYFINDDKFKELVEKKHCMNMSIPISGQNTERQRSR